MTRRNCKWGRRLRGVLSSYNFPESWEENITGEEHSLLLYLVSQSICTGKVGSTVPQWLPSDMRRWTNEVVLVFTAPREVIISTYIQYCLSDRAIIWHQFGWISLIWTISNPIDRPFPRWCLCWWWWVGGWGVVFIVHICSHQANNSLAEHNALGKNWQIFSDTFFVTWEARSVMGISVVLQFFRQNSAKDEVSTTHVSKCLILMGRKMK